MKKASMDTYEILTKLNTGFLMSDSSGNIELCFVATGLLARLHLHEGQISAARGLVNSFNEKVINQKADQLLPNMKAMQTYLALLEGDLYAVKQWLLEAPDENVSFYILDRYRYAMKIRCLIVLKRVEETLDLIERLNAYYIQYERHYMWIENQILKSIVLYRLHRPEWKNVLVDALTKAQRYHFVRVFAQEGRAIKPLLDNLLDVDIKKDFLKQIVDETNKMAKHFPKYLYNRNPVFDQLTDMEENILYQYCEGLSTAKVCESNFISYNTLKFHNKNIYKKLGVKSRKEAEDFVKNNQYIS